KPAVAKSGGKPEPFRAYVQEAVSQVQARVLGEQFVVPIKAVEVEGRFGTIQPLLDVKGDLKKIPLADLTPDQLRMIQQEHVIDWLVGNFDSHPGNHIVLADGRIIGIDKEQAFRYIADPKSWRVSTTYHPNAVYGEAPPIHRIGMVRRGRSEEHTSELQSRENLVCRLLLEKKKTTTPRATRSG